MTANVRQGRFESYAADRASAGDETGGIIVGFAHKVLQVEGSALFANAALLQRFTGIVENLGKVARSVDHVFCILAHGRRQGAMAQGRALAQKAVERRAQQVLPFHPPVRAHAPRHWVAALIRETALAQEEWAAFRQAYPDYPVAEELRQRLEKK